MSEVVSREAVVLDAPAAFPAAVLAVRRERETARLTAQQAAARPAGQAPQPVIRARPPAGREPSPPGEFAPPA